MGHGNRVRAMAAWSCAGVAVLMTTGYLLLVLTASGGASATPVMVTADVLYGVVPALIGAVVASRVRANAIGWVLIGISLAVTPALGNEYGLRATQEGWPLADAGPALAALGASLGFSFFVFVPLLFPTGRPLSPRWRPAVWLALIGIGLSTIGSTLRPDSPGVEAPLVNPLGVQSLASVAKVIEGVGAGCWATAVVLGVLSAILRFRRSNGAERSQLKWVVYAFVVMPVLILGANLAADVPLVGIPLVLAGTGTVPGAIALAILRYRLYDIDRLVNRTLVYAGVSGVLAIAYVGPVLLAQLLLSGEHRPAWVVAMSTLGAAALFQPVRRRVQRWVDRRFYRERYDADRTVNAFAARLRDNVDLDTVNDDLLGVVRRTMQPERAVLWLRP